MRRPPPPTPSQAGKRSLYAAGFSLIKATAKIDGAKFHLAKVPYQILVFKESRKKNKNPKLYSGLKFKKKIALRILIS